MVILLFGGGDLASGVALRLFRAGLRPIITELPQPLAVRRLVSFAEAVYSGRIDIEGVAGVKVCAFKEALVVRGKNEIPVLPDPDASSIIYAAQHSPLVVIDGRMRKLSPSINCSLAQLVIGLGPGFEAGKNCHAVVETNRGHNLGRVIWNGKAQADTGVPEIVLGRGAERVLRAPVDGVLQAHAHIGDLLTTGQLIANVDGEPIFAPFDGVLRGILHTGVVVPSGLKIGDVDPRCDPSMCSLVSDKSLSVGGGVLEAILARPELRPHLWEE